MEISSSTHGLRSGFYTGSGEVVHTPVPCEAWSSGEMACAPVTCDTGLIDERSFYHAATDKSEIANLLACRLRSHFGKSELRDPTFQHQSINHRLFNIVKGLIYKRIFRVGRYCN